MSEYHPDAVRVHDHGYVRLHAHTGDDLSVVNAARVSYNKQVPEVSDADEKLISYLLRNKHGTPFEHNLFTFVVRCPIFVMRQWIRHRISSFNEMSGRYVELPNQMWAPEAETVRMRVGKPGAYTYELMIEQPGKEETAEWVAGMIRRHNVKSYQIYQDLLEVGTAPEQARVVLPTSIYTEFWWTVNARSLMNFMALRNDGHAQAEINDYALAVEAEFAKSMPVTYDAFVAADRTAP